MASTLLSYAVVSGALLCSAWSFNTEQLRTPGARFAEAALLMGQGELGAALGRAVQREAVANGVGSFTLSLTSVSAGMYSVHVSNGTTWLTGAKLLSSP